MPPTELWTKRLRLREWREEDRAPFAALNADPRVAEFLPTPLGRVESDAFLERAMQHFRDHGFGIYAVESRSERGCIGFIGLSVAPFEAAFTPCVEIGWRLAAEHWGRGLATEGARAVMAHAFGALRLAEIVSWTVPANARSRRVMEKLGMTHNPADDFDHPRLPAGEPLRRHVMYRLSATSWYEKQQIFIDKR